MAHGDATADRIAAGKLMARWDHKASMLHNNRLDFFEVEIFHFEGLYPLIAWQH